MAVTLVDPNGLPQIDIYRQVSVATGSRLIHLAGQVAWDGGDFATQVEHNYLNVGTALAGVGATFADVVKLTVHVVDWKLPLMPELLDGIARASQKLGVTISAPASLFGIVALDVPSTSSRRKPPPSSTSTSSADPGVLHSRKFVHRPHPEDPPAPSHFWAGRRPPGEGGLWGGLFPGGLDVAQVFLGPAAHAVDDGAQGLVGLGRQLADLRPGPHGDQP